MKNFIANALGLLTADDVQAIVPDFNIRVDKAQEAAHKHRSLAASQTAQANALYAKAAGHNEIALRKEKAVKRARKAAGGN